MSKRIPVGGLFSRNSVAHKWKTPYRSLILREAVCWRVHDLLNQAHMLAKGGHILGSRILIRSALETTAILIYLNQQTQKVILGDLDFHEFSETTSKLLLGSRDGTTSYQSVNILTVLKHCEKKYRGIIDMYNILSECAHTNYEGECYGYSKVDHENFETNFSNNWLEMWNDKHVSIMLFVIHVFPNEYNVIWTKLFDELEVWVEQNDSALEASK